MRPLLSHSLVKDTHFAMLPLWTSTTKPQVQQLPGEHKRSHATEQMIAWLEPFGNTATYLLKPQQEQISGFTILSKWPLWGAALVVWQFFFDKWSCCLPPLWSGGEIPAPPRPLQNTPFSWVNPDSVLTPRSFHLVLDTHWTISPLGGQPPSKGSKWHT